jgi:RHS repeat-associated protein
LTGQEQNGAYSQYHFDSRGSTVALTDANGNVTDRFEYDSYGTSLAHTGTSDTPFQYNGRFGVQTDSNGLLYMRARYYNPAIKRFINQDVLFGDLNPGISLNRFAFANGNPISLIDPFGLCAQDDSMETDPMGNPTSVAGGQRMLSFEGRFAQGMLNGATGLASMPWTAAQQLGKDTYYWSQGENPPSLALSDIGPALAQRFSTPEGMGELTSDLLAGSILGELGAAESGTSIIGQSFGKLGTVVENPGLDITGFTEHGINQAITRGVSPQSLLNTITEPLNQIVV